MGYRYRFSSLFALMIAPVMVSNPSFSQTIVEPEAATVITNKEQTPEAEIVYRANLGRADDITLLLKKGISPDQTDEEGAPVLALASARKDAEGINVVKAILAGGGNINAIDTNGQTALFYAAKNGNTEIVQLLLESGIDYYREDNNGTIARTIAHKNGFPEIVAQMDQFVKKQTEIIQQQYQELHQQLTDRYKNEQDALASSQRLSEQVAQEAAAKAAAEAAKAQEEILKKRASPEFERSMRELALNSCSFQYWSFCKEAKSSTDLSKDELSVAIESRKEIIAASILDIAKEYTLEIAYVDSISTEAKTRIFTMLQATPSNIYRREHGICTMQDMKTRCDKISTSWNEKAPAKKVVVPAAAPAVPPTTPE
ncbi:MAG: ankyrin repeat domain-containing protein [Rickettsiales bacterium]|nr:ankyrin repeat domain-containing protein [Rickettsiales bacterium]